MQILSALIADYLETGDYEKQLSPDTIKAYRIDLRQFLDFTGGVWADRNMLSQYIKYLNQYFAPRSAKRKLASVRAFYHEMEICGELWEKPIRIHSPQQLPRVIPEQIVQILLLTEINFVKQYLVYTLLAEKDLLRNLQQQCSKRFICMPAGVERHIMEKPGATEVAYPQKFMWQLIG